MFCILHILYYVHLSFRPFNHIAGNSMSEKTVEKAQQMIQDLLLAGYSGVKISEGSGVNQVTIGALKNGKSQRVTEKVFDRLWDYWSENVPPKEKLEQLRAEKGQSTGRKKASEKAPASESAQTASAKPKRKYTKRSVSETPSTEGFINRNYVPVDLNALNTTIDKLISQFSDTLKELEAIRKQIK